jgi:hypothetical protein
VTPVAAMLMGILAGSPVKDASGTTILWLVVGASDSSPAGISRAAKGLATKSPGALVFQTVDCGEKRNVFGVALELPDSAAAAKVALQRVRRTVEGAYIKRCTVTPRSLLSLRFPAVDSSIANVPDDAVNWEDSDRVSTAINLADGRDLVARRVFVDDPEDPLEGRRVTVILASGHGKGKVLTDDCGWPERFKEHDGQIAFQCAGAEAGDQLLHTVLVFDANGSQLAKVEQCRNPTLPDGTTVICSEESVNANGRLKLRSARVPLTLLKAPVQRLLP